MSPKNLFGGTVIFVLLAIFFLINMIMIAFICIWNR